MNLPAQKLLQIVEKKSRLIIGLMSGTSLDGLDIALCRVNNSGFETKIDMLAFETKKYSAQIKNRILEVFALPNISFAALTTLHRDLGCLHADLILDFLQTRNIAKTDIDLIGSHGQTVFHLPSGYNDQAATLQIGDADHIATRTGIITVSDFRQQHIAAGGEGAPLAPYGDLLLLNRAGKASILINIGGISNFSLLKGPGEKVFFSDMGPGNTLLDQVTRQRLNLLYDANGELASKGQCNDILLKELLANPFLIQPFPKTTGPELFNLKWLNDNSSANLDEISTEDLLHTLSKFTARTIANAIKKLKVDAEQTEIFFSGGGVHNKFLMDLLKQELSAFKTGTTKDLGIDPDAKEAILFALLANESVAGKPNIFEGSGLIPVRMGKISFPGFL